MIHEHDIAALIELLRRTPMSMAETLYANDLVQRLRRAIDPPTGDTLKDVGEGEPHTAGSS